MIDIMFESEQSQLSPFQRIFRFGSAHHDKAIRFEPAHGLVAELCHLPMSLKAVISQGFEFFLNGSGHLGDHDKLDVFVVEQSNEVAIVEPGVRPNADAIDSLGDFVQRLPRKRLKPCNRIPVSGS